MAIAYASNFGATNSDGAAATRTVSGLTISAGSLVVVGLNHYTDISVTGVADDLSANATFAVARYGATGTKRCELWYFMNHGGGTRNFTVTYATSAQYGYVCVSEYTGAALTDAFEGKASNNASGTTPTTGNLDVTPSVDGMLIVGHCTGYTNCAGAAPFTQIDVDGVSTWGNHEFYVQPTKADIAATWTQNSGGYAAVAASFLPPSAAGIIQHAHHHYQNMRG